MTAGPVGTRPDVRPVEPADGEGTLRRVTPSEEPDAEAIAVAVQRCEGVSRLYGGVGGEIATYLPGRRVPGVRVAERHVEVHVVGRYGPSMAAIAAEVRAAVTAVVPFFVTVDVVIEDLDVPGEEPAGTTE